MTSSPVFIVTKWMIARIKNMFSTLGGVVQTFISTTIMSNPKYFFGILVVLVLTVVSIYIYMYLSFTARYNLKRTPEHFVQFVKFTTGDTTLHKQMKNAEQHESRGEMMTRAVLESMFKPHKFPKVRLEYIVNPVTNHPLEFDCYCDDLKTAVEYNGIQHYKYVPYFHKSKQDFYNQQYRDRIKQQLCDQYGIKLINIPYTVAIKELPMYLMTVMSTVSNPPNPIDQAPLAPDYDSAQPDILSDQYTSL